MQRIEFGGKKFWVWESDHGWQYGETVNVQGLLKDELLGVASSEQEAGDKVREECVKHLVALAQSIGGSGLECFGHAIIIVRPFEGEA